MKPARVGPVDPSEDRPAGVRAWIVYLALYAFSFEALPERFGDGVIPAHAGAAHRRPKLTFMTVVDVIVRRVLSAPICMGDDPGHMLGAAPGRNRHAQRVGDELGAHVLSHR